MSLKTLPEVLKEIVLAAHEHKDDAPLKVERIPLARALNQVLASDVVAKTAVPPADNSAMDGFAINMVDFKPGVTLAVSQRVAAGYPAKALEPGTAARIFTGAEIPEGADVVIAQESCEYDDNVVKILCDDLKVGKNIRPKGQDISAGQQVFAAGLRLKPQDLGVIASTGVGKVETFRALRIALINTGDELVEPGRFLGPGKIYNSNRAMLLGLIQSQGWLVNDLGSVGDDLGELERVLISAAQGADCIITTGGVSVGQEDHVKSAIRNLGELNIWRLGIKPGKPLAFGRVLNTPCFGLPGNPASALVTYLLIVKRFLKVLQGQEDCEPELVWAKANFDHEQPGSRDEFIRARYSVNSAGDSIVDRHSNQSSGVLSSASWSNGLAVLPKDATIAKGDVIAFLPMTSLLYG